MMIVGRWRSNDDCWEMEEEGLFDAEDDGWGGDDRNCGQKVDQMSSPGSCCGDLNALEEEGAAASPCCDDDIDANVEDAMQGGPGKGLQYTSLQNFDNDVRFVSPGAADDGSFPELNTAPANIMSNGAYGHMLLPSPSAEYDDPSLFDHSFMSDSSSELTPMIKAAPPPSSQQQQQQKRSAANNRPTPLTMQLANKTNKDLTTFLDKFDSIFQGCRDGDNDSSDVFMINDSQFGKDNSGFSDDSQFGSEFSGFDDDPFAKSLFDTTDDSIENSLVGIGNNLGQSSKKSQLHYGSKQRSGDSTSSLLAEPAPPSRFAPLRRANPTLEEEDSMTMSDDRPRELNRTPLPPASTFLSHKDRARIRQHDTTPLRTNTSRAVRSRRLMVGSSKRQLRSFSIGETSMSSIKEGMEDDAETDKEEEGDEGDDESNGPSHEHDDRGRDAAALQDAIEPISSDSWSRLCPTIEEDPDIAPPSKKTEPSHISKEDPPLTSNGPERQQPFDRNGNNDPPSSDEIKMTYREKRKGNSLAWHSANGVNEDELMYDSKQRLPPSSRKRAGLLAGR